MNGYTINFMKINGASNDTLVIEQVKSAKNAQNVSTTQIAKKVQYATSDTSKGTIEQRLSALGG